MTEEIANEGPFDRSCQFRIIMAMPTSAWFWLVSPSYKLAERRKRGLVAQGNKSDVTQALKQYNKFYLRVTLILTAAIGLGFHQKLYHEFPSVFLAYTVLFSFGYLLFSRACEIFVAFLSDAVEKLNGVDSQSDLLPGDRLRLAFNSYIEIMFGFGTLYYILPANWFGFKDPNVSFQNIYEAIYFSGVTMTTVGYGDISPTFCISQMLVLLQVFCSLTLALVSFTVYTSLALAKLTEKKN